MSIDDMQEYILNRRGDDKENHLLEQQLVRAYEDQGDFIGLRRFLDDLPLYNTQAFSRLSAYLMEHYRQQQDEPAAKAVATALLAQLGYDSDVQNRVAYFEVAERLAGLDGQVPDSEDVEQLREISSSGTSFAPVACATLRYYFPEYTCENQSTGRRVSTTSSTHLALHLPTGKVSTLGEQLLVTPNPARETVQLTFRAVSGLVDSSANFVVRVPAPLKQFERRGDANYKVRATAHGLYTNSETALSRYLTILWPGRANFNWWP